MEFGNEAGKNGWWHQKDPLDPSQLHGPLGKQVNEEFPGEHIYVELASDGDLYNKISKKANIFFIEIPKLPNRDTFIVSRASLLKMHKSSVPIPMKYFLDHEGIEHINKVCSNEKVSIYTDPEGDICPNGGWLDLTFDECKEKCRRNELPEGCNIVKPPGGCAFAIWRSTRCGQNCVGKCKLANSQCIMDKGPQQIWENPKRRK